MKNVVKTGFTFSRLARFGELPNVLHKNPCEFSPLIVLKKVRDTTCLPFKVQTLKRDMQRPKFDTKVVTAFMIRNP